MIDYRKDSKLKLKLIYSPFYLEKQYKKVVENTGLSAHEKLDGLCDIFYDYFDMAFDEVSNNDYREVVLYGIHDFDGIHFESESFIDIKSERAEQKTLELAEFILDCDINKADLEKVSESTKNMYVIAMNSMLGITENFQFKTLQTKFLDIKKQELENQLEK